MAGCVPTLVKLCVLSRGFVDLMYTQGGVLLINVMAPTAKYCMYIYICVLELIQVIISFYMRHDAVRIFGCHSGMHGKYKVMSWFSWASSVMGASSSQ